MRLTKDTKKLLIEKTRFNLELIEIVDNVRILSRYLMDKTRTLEFRLKSIDVKRLDTIGIKQMILSKSYRELGMNESTLWCQKKRLERSGSIRIYNNTKHHFI